MLLRQRSKRINLARRTDFVTGAGFVARTGLSYDVFPDGRPRGPAYPRLFWVPVWPLWPAEPWTWSRPSSGAKCWPARTISHVPVFLLREAVRAERRAQARLHGPSPAHRAELSSLQARAPRPAPPESWTRPCAAAGQAARARSCRSGIGRQQAQTVPRLFCVPALELGRRAPAFRSPSARCEGRAEPHNLRSRRPGDRGTLGRGLSFSSRALLLRRLRPWPANRSCARSLQRFLPCRSRMCGSRSADGPASRARGFAASSRSIRGYRLRHPLKHQFPRGHCAQDGGANRPAFLRFVRERSASRSGWRL